MPFLNKLKGFWFSGPPWRKWLKRVLAVVIAWPLVMTLVYRFVPPPFSNVMLLRLATGHGLEKSWMPLGRISPHLATAVIAAEDQRFCDHRGIDFQELRAAYQGGERRGASTISMQVAKNMFLWDGHSFIRKGLELPLASYMDAILGKRRMIEIYLNVAEWGPGLYGAEAASQFHFHKPAAQLTRGQAALLAASLPNPYLRVAGKPSRTTRLVAGRISQRMAALGPAQLACL